MGFSQYANLIWLGLQVVADHLAVPGQEHQSTKEPLGLVKIRPSEPTDP